MPLDHAAEDLALHDLRIDHSPAVLADDVPEDRDPPVSTSTSQVQMWHALENVNGGALYRCDTSSPGVMPGGSMSWPMYANWPSSAKLIPLVAVPRTKIRPLSTSRSSTAASSASAAISSNFDRNSMLAAATALPYSTALRLPCVPAPYGSGGGVALDYADVFRGTAKVFGDHLFHGCHDTHTGARAAEQRRHLAAVVHSDHAPSVPNAPKAIADGSTHRQIPMPR